MNSSRQSSHYSLWLVPTGDARQQLAGTILGLSRAFCAPSFEPHVTLASGITGPAGEVASKMRRLAKSVAPFTVRLTKVDGLEEYFRCLFVRVAPTHPIMSANERAREAFHLERQAGFMPHLSLLYGRLPCDMKERIIVLLARQFGLGFKVSRLQLYLIKGQPAAWRRMASCGLGL